MSGHMADNPIVPRVKQVTIASCRMGNKTVRAKANAARPQTRDSFEHQDWHALTLTPALAQLWQPISYSAATRALCRACRRQNGA